MRATHSDDGVDGLLQLAPGRELLELLLCPRQLVAAGTVPVLNPRVIETLANSQALLGLHMQDLLDKVLGTIRDVVPVRRWEGVVALLDLLEEN